MIQNTVYYYILFFHHMSVLLHLIGFAAILVRTQLYIFNLSSFLVSLNILKRG